MIHLPRTFHLRPLPTADLHTHTPFPSFRRRRQVWLLSFRNPSRLRLLWGAR